MTATRLEPRTTYFVNEYSTIWPNWPNHWAVFWVLICTVHSTVCSCHVTYAFYSESTLYSCLNVKELFFRSRREIWRLSDCNWTRTQNHLAKLGSLAKWLSVRLRTKWFRIRVQLHSQLLFISFALFVAGIFCLVFEYPFFGIYYKFIAIEIKTLEQITMARLQELNVFINPKT